MSRPAKIISAAANVIMGRLLLEMARKKFMSSRVLVAEVDALIAKANHLIEAQRDEIATANPDPWGRNCAQPAAVVVPKTYTHSGHESDADRL